MGICRHGGFVFCYDMLWDLDYTRGKFKALGQ